MLHLFPDFSFDFCYSCISKKKTVQSHMLVCDRIYARISALNHLYAICFVFKILCWVNSMQWENDLIELNHRILCTFECFVCDLVRIF